MDKKLLDILCCPISKQSLLPLSAARLQALNEGIARSLVHQQDGKLLDIPLKQALISSEQKWIYRIDDGIPVLLSDEAIAAGQLDPAVL